MPPPSRIRAVLSWAVRLALAGGLLAFAVSRMSFWDTVALKGGEVVAGEILEESPAGIRIAPRSGAAERTLPPETWAGGRAVAVRRGLIPSVRGLRWGWFLPSAALVGPIMLLGTWRWKVLLAAQDVALPFRTAVRLTFVGHFFNTIFPGLTGGDVVKAVYVAREADRKSRAVFSLVVDRFAGASGLAVVGAVGAFAFAPAEAMRPLAVWVGRLCGACLAFGAILLSERLRRVLGISYLIRRLPFARAVAEIEEGLRLYRDRPGAIGFALGASMVGQFSFVLLYSGVGRAIGLEGMGLGDYLVLVPVISIIKGVSPTPGSAGFAEGIMALFVGGLGLDVTQVVLLSLLVTGTLFAWGWPGAALLILGRVSRRAAGPVTAGERA